MKCVISVLLAVAVAVPVLSQVTQKDDRVTIGTSEVVLDVVVRDKKGRTVKDLKLPDFEVLEDGMRQNVSSFRIVSRESLPANTADKPKSNTAAESLTPAPTGGGSREPFSGINLIAMVFDHLSANARNLAHKAAISFVDESLQPDDLATVCVIDNSLRVIQPYTGDARLLKQAVDRATSIAVSSADSGSAQRRSLEESSTGLDNTISRSVSTASAGGPGNSGAAAGSAGGAAAMDQAIADMQIRALDTFEMLERNQQGQAQINSLLAVINSLKDVPGRKAIVLFSEGIALPVDVKVHLPSVLHAANRANVSIYAIEAGGLRVESGNAEAARELSSMGNRRARQNANGREDRSGRPMTMALERTEDLLKLNPQSGLGDLAYGTGGMLIADTNDLSGALRRIDEDLRTHYVLTYQPKNTTLDGRFRQISVKVAKGGMDVQARKGYYALPSTGSTPVLDYEAPALAAMHGAAASNSFPFRIKAFDFPGKAIKGVTPIVAEAPASAFTYKPSVDKKTYSSDFTILALIRNEAQQVVSKLSRHYTLSGAIDQLGSAQKGEILFYKEQDLRPGKYFIDAIAFDAPTGKVSMQSDSFEVLRSDQDRLRASSLIILKRADRLSAQEQKQPNPFHFGELLMYPNLGEPVRKSAMKQLPFFFSVYVPEGTKTAPKLAIQVLQHEQRLARLQAELGSPDAEGHIQYASTIPLETFQPGSYQLQITVSDGQSSITRMAAFSVAP